jgi:hypothetical protein
MPWIKRNLTFVICLAVAVILIGGGVFYWMSARADAEAADQALIAKNSELDQLTQRDPYPSQENTRKAREEQERVAAFLKQAKAQFSVIQKAESLDNASFKRLLLTTLAELSREADRKGVKLPEANYSFTFGSQRKELQIPEKALAPLAAQLADVEHVCRILFDAKIHSLAALKRTAVGTNDSTSSPDILNKKVGTNTVVSGSIHPYEVQFQCFSVEFANVLNGFMTSSNAILIKTINVERGSLESTAAAAVPAMPGGMDPIFASRYGLLRGAPSAPAVQPAAPGSRPGDIVLEPKPLKITIGLEIVRLAAPPTNAPARRQAPAAPATASN